MLIKPTSHILVKFIINFDNWVVRGRLLNNNNRINISPFSFGEMPNMLPLFTVRSKCMVIRLKWSAVKYFTYNVSVALLTKQ